MSFRTLHSFTISLDKTVEETETREENGQKISITKQVEKPVPYTIILKEPSRREKNELSLFKDTTYGEAIKRGLITRLEMQQRIVGRDAKNPISEHEDKNLAQMTARLQELANEFLRLNAAKSEQETEDAKERKEKLLMEYLALFKKVEEINTAYQSVFEHTAENHTQTKMLTWLTLFLTYYTEVGSSDSVPKPLFPGSDYETKEARAGELEDSQDPLFLKALEKLPMYWMAYLFGRASKTEEFVRFDEDMAKRAEAEAKMKEEHAKEDEKAKVTPLPATLSEEAKVEVKQITTDTIVEMHRVGGVPPQS